MEGPRDKVVPDYSTMPDPELPPFFLGELAQERFKSGGTVNRLVVPEEEDSQEEPQKSVVS